MSHTQRDSPVPPSPPDPLVVPLIRVYPRVRPTLPLPSIGISFSPFPSLFLFLPLPPSRNATRHASGDTRGPTQVMHGPPYIFDPLFGLFFPTGLNVRCLSCPRRRSVTSLTSPPRPRSFSSRCRALERSRLSPSLFRALSISPLFSPFLVSAVRNTPLASSEHPRRTSVTPVIVRLLTGMYANDMPGGFAA